MSIIGLCIFTILFLIFHSRNFLIFTSAKRLRLMKAAAYIVQSFDFTHVKKAATASIGCHVSAGDREAPALPPSAMACPPALPLHLF